ncbi:MAG: MltA domain-containing protein [Candidatus Aerophobetes bacterium]|nr:MltA domain-containing protein [Candidatus Aerophobetes bacterium]
MFSSSRAKIFLAVFVSCSLVVEFAILYYFLILTPKKPPLKPPGKYLIEVQKDKAPEFIFSDKDLGELRKAFQREEEFLSKKITYERGLSFGEEKISPFLIKESAQLLLETLQEAKTEEELNRLIKKRFLIYEAAGEKGEILFTAYYTPVYEGSLTREGPYRCPLYLRPKDLKVANLGEFNPSLEGERIVYRIDNSQREIVPYWSRENIVKNKVLEGQNLEFIYLKDRLDRFYLMIEGSGKINLNNGETFWVRYSASNGRVYTSLGRRLVKEGEIPEDKLSIQSIREYFQHHPHRMDQYLNQNERFIFFTRDKEIKGAVGAGGCELTPKRSIAIDKKIFPLGAVAYIEYPEPEINREDEVVGIKKRGRFVLCQDTGGAIKGPERVDVYFGEGEEALAKAKHLKGKGKLYFLIKK